MNDATSTPNQADVDALRGLLDLMANFESNDQRARFLLSSNWMRDRDAAPVASPERVAEVLAAWLDDHDNTPVNFGTTAQLPAEYRALADEATAALAEAGVFRDEAEVRALEGTQTHNRIVEALAAERDKHDRMSTGWAYLDGAITIASQAEAGAS